MLIAMAGLPGSGKSTLATCLEPRLGAVVLDKDRVRAALFPPRVTTDGRFGGGWRQQGTDPVWLTLPSRTSC
jgi:predicted kinase